MQERLRRAAVLPTATETVSLTEALNRVLAMAQQARVDVPPADNAAMDGYAFRLDDLRAANGALPVSQRIPAGTVPQPLTAKTAARIFTGADVPAQADCVVMQEDTEEKNGVLQVRPDALATLKPGVHIRRRGEDMQAGSAVLPAGTRLGPPQLGVLAAAGHADVPVYPRLRVAFFSTGDELLEPGEAPQPGRIYNSNRYALRAYLEQLGCHAIDMGVVRDDRAATVAALCAAAAQADLVITTGGASVGEEDHLKAAMMECGRVDLWKVAIKPGKPVLFGQLHTAQSANTANATPTANAANATQKEHATVPMLGLPGNPVSVAVTFLVLAVPFLRAMQGQPSWQSPAYQLPAGFTVKKAISREEYLRARVVASPQGMQLEKHPHQGSGVLTSVAWSEGLVRVPANRTVAAGDLLEFLPFTGLLG